MQVFYAAAGLHHTEQSGGGDAGVELQAGDGVPASVEAAAEAGGGEIVDAAQGNVTVQDHGLVRRPGVVGALLRESEEVLRAPDVNRLSLIRRKRGNSGPGQQKRGQDQGENKLYGLIPHDAIPPLPRRR